jgi:hypothetical protein
MEVKIANDRVFEALLRQAVIDNFYEELSSVPPDEELAKTYTFSAAHILRMERLLARAKRKETLQAGLLWSRRVAAAVAIATAIIFGSLMLNQEVRAAVSGTIIEWFDRFTRFTSNAPPADTSATATANEPSYIPDGFWEELRDELETMTTILYTNEDEVYILFGTVRASGSLSVINEWRAYEINRIDGIDYHVFTAISANAENSVIWEAGGIRYNLTSTIPIEDLLDMAFSVD